MQGEKAGEPSAPGASGERKTAMPTTARVLKRLDPTMLPRTNSCSPRRALATALASSGSEVPAATIVSPITRSSTPIALAKSTAPQTRKCDEPTRTPSETTTFATGAQTPKVSSADGSASEGAAGRTGASSGFSSSAVALAPRSSQQ